MLQFFKSKFALIPILSILALMIFLRANVLFNHFYLDFWNGDLDPFSRFLYNSIGTNFFKNLWFQLIVSSGLIFLQTNILISIVSRFKNAELTGFLVAWFYVLLMHLFPAFVFLSPQLIALTFVLFAFRSLLLVEESKIKIKEIFNAGLFLGIASSFWAPSLIFLLLALFVLLKVKKFSTRGLLVLFISFVIPYFYTATYFLLTEQKFNLVETLAFNQFQISFYKPGQLLSIAIVVLLLLFSFTYLNQFLSKQLVQVKDFFKYLFFYLFCILILFFIQNENSINGLMFLVFPISLFLNILFNRIKRNFLAESLHLILLLSIVVNFLYFVK